ncbi:MAG: hypothetical protein ACTSVE_15205 [Candidatus Helarchaeota archaeon]
MIGYNGAIFKTTHNSYSGNLNGKKGSLLEQLNKGIRGIELDIYGLRNFLIGHRYPGHEVDFNGISLDQRISKLSLKNWLKIVKSWSDSHRIGCEKPHLPITLFLDIRLIIEHSVYFAYDELNSLIGNVFEDSLFTPEDFKKSSWPDLDTLRGKIIVVLTGEKAVKWRYVRKFNDKEKKCFISFTYRLDGLGKNGKSKNLLDEATFINVKINDWQWANSQFEKGKIIRLFYFDRLFRLNSYFKCYKIKCNFPASDYPYGREYDDFLKVLSETHPELELIE